MKVLGNIRFLSLDELSNFLGLSKVTLRSYIKSGKLDGRKIGQRWYVTEHSVSKLVKGSDYDNKPLEYVPEVSGYVKASIPEPTVNTHFAINPRTNIAQTQPIDFYSFIASKVITPVIPFSESDYIFELWLDPKGLITFISPMTELFAEYTPEEITQNPNIILEIIHPSDRERVSRIFAETVINKTPNDIYYRINTKYGRTLWINHQSIPIYLTDGKYLGRQILMRNITETKLAETAISELWPHIDYNAIINAPIIMFNEARTIMRLYNYNSMLSNIIFDQTINVGDTIDATTGGPNLNKVYKCLEYLDLHKKYSIKLTVANNPRIDINCYAFRLEIPPVKHYHVIVLL